MKSLVIYHAHCADGFGAAFAAWMKLGDDAEYLPMSYSDDALRDVSYEGRDVYVLDFSFDRTTTEILFGGAHSVVWLDHHKTAFETWCGWGCNIELPFKQIFTDPSVFILLDNNKSGALIAWEYFHPDTPVPMLIQHLDDYDRWQFKLDGTKAFNKALWSYAPWSFDQWKTKFLPADTGKRNLTFYATAIYSDLCKEGAAILRAHDQNVAAVVEAGVVPCTMYVRWQDSESIGTCPKPGLAANAPYYLASDVGHALANRSGTYGLVWALNKDGRVKCSIRSNGDYDVSAIAKQFGGGGHKNAAGFEVSMEQLHSWLR